MGLISRILSGKEEKDIGPNTVDSVIGHSDNYDREDGTPYWSSNVEEVGRYLDDLPQNASGTLNGESIAEGREEVKELYDKWVGDIDRRNEYLVQETTIKEDNQARMTIKVGEVDQVVYEVDSDRFGESSTKKKSSLPEPGIGRAEIQHTELGEPSYEIEITWERTT